CPEGTLSSRLSRGREMLRERLARRGLVLTVAALMAALSSSTLLATAPPSLLSSTLQAATAFAAGSTVAAGIAVLTKGVLTTMMLNKFKMAAAVMLSLAMIGG